MDVLFIGGTGIISSACSALALERGINLHLINRGRSRRPIPEGAVVHTGDINDPDWVNRVLGDRVFDAVVDWIIFTPDQLERDLQLFSGRTRQYVLISSASAYQTPPQSLPVTEDTPLENPFWQYSRDKIACEQRLMRAHREDGFPATIVRPSHTYDRTLIPLSGGYTNLARMKAGKPIVVHGDGASIWTVTHHTDFAKGFVGLLGNSAAIGEAFHITADFYTTWDRIVRDLAAALGVEAKIVHIPSDVIAAYDSGWGDGLLGDKAHSMIFDNSKIKSLVPDFDCRIEFSEGAKEIVAWYEAHPEAQVVDEKFDALCDRLIEARNRMLP